MFHISGEKGLSSLESYPLPWRYHRSGFSQQCPFPASAVGRLPDAAQSGPSCPGPFPPGHPAAVRQLSGRRFQTNSPQTAGSCSLGLQSPVAWPCRQDGQTGLAALILLHPALSWRMISTTLPSSPSLLCFSPPPSPFCNKTCLHRICLILRLFRRRRDVESIFLLILVFLAILWIYSWASATTPSTSSTRP